MEPASVPALPVVSLASDPGRPRRTVMRSMAGLVAAVILVAGLGPAAAQKGKPAREVVVAGKSISEWAKTLQGKDVLGRARAINALIQAGPEARLG